MAKAKLFEKRIARAHAALVREIGKRAAYDVVLIVCEGSKTEPRYLNDLKADLSLSNANIRIVEEPHGNDPLSVVQFAVDCYVADPTYDRIYCIFDKDGHSTYQPALSFLQSHELSKAKKLFGINSVPCFEIWLLLHYGYTTKAYEKTGKNSSCGHVIRDLKKHIPDYEKSCQGVFEKVKDKTGHALTNARRLHRHNTLVNTDNPYTRLHELIGYLQGLGASRNKS